MSPELLLAAAVAPDGGPTVIVIVALVTVIGTIATALGPTLVEVAKNRRASGSPPAPIAPGSEVAGDPVAFPSSPDNPLTPVVQSGIDALSMVNAAVQDYREQRDAALQRVDQLQRLLDDARATIGQQLVELTQVHARLARYEPEAPSDTYGRQQPMYPPDPPYGNWRPR